MLLQLRRCRHRHRLFHTLLLLVSCTATTITEGWSAEDQVEAEVKAPARQNMSVLLNAPPIESLSAAAVSASRSFQRLRAALEAVFRWAANLARYRPPTGFVIVAVVARLVLTGRIFRLYTDNNNNEDSSSLDAAVLSQQQQASSRRRSEQGRAFVLLEDDRSYSQWGGMQPVRRRLCWSALRDIDCTSKNNGAYHSNNNAMLRALTTALEVTSSAPLRLASSMIKPMATLEYVEQQRHPASSRYTKFTRAVARLVDDDMLKLLMLAQLTARVRAVDAMLRVCRDRLLKTVYRLATTVEHFDRIVQKSSSRRPSTIETNRNRLADASASYGAEMKRLGETLSVLLNRPPDTKQEFLLQALRDSGRSTESPAAAAAEKKEIRSLKQLRRRLINVTKLPKYSLRWKSHSSGRGFLSIRKFNSGDEYINGSCAVAALFADPNRDAFIRKSSSWEQHARKVLCRVVRESLQGSISSSTSRSDVFSDNVFAKLEKEWCQPQRQGGGEGGTSDVGRNSTMLGGTNETNKIGLSTATDACKEKEDTWRGILNYVDSLPLWRRAGEGQKIRLKDVLFSLQWIKYLDLFGIPSSLLVVYGANLIHDYLIEPYWLHIRRDALDVLRKAIEIVVTRFWLPVKGIWDDIMNKNAGIFEGFGFGLDEEQKFLDHMLLDLGFGDGTPLMREEALRLATEEYERDFYSGLFTNFLTGRLARLMLVQVQQLKVGLLLAVDTTDTLMQGNRIHFQLLAAIPAVLIATYGTRFFLRGFYNVRAKDIRPIRAVHREMATFLDRIESLILLIGRSHSPSTNGNSNDDSNNNGLATSSSKLSPSQLGDLCLNMHRYLILMDFASPPFPASCCDDIHNDLRAIWTMQQHPQGLPTSQQVHWVERIKQKHQELLKFL